MTTPKISVVVPIYKVEECLAWCLDSLLAQDMPDWEGVLVNDGSPDSSRDIAATYCEKDARFTLVDKENGGLSSARNAGICVHGAYRRVFGFRRPLYARCMPRDRRCL